MGKKQPIFWIEQLCKEDNDTVGKKCANLGELSRIGVKVPHGFAISCAAWESFVELTGIARDMQQIFEEEKGQLHVPARGQKVSQTVRELIEAQDMPDEIGATIRSRYRELCKRTALPEPPLAVRSAGVVSMPGAMETYLNVKGEEEVLKKIVRVWSSAYTHRAILYRHNQGLNAEYAPIGVAVLQLVDAKCAGVLMTANPTSGNTSEMIIESNWGLGESVVSGIMNPDRFTVEKDSLKVIARTINRKLKTVEPKGNSADLIDIPVDKQTAPSLTDDEVMELARVGLQIENHFGGPTDIEWAYASNVPFPNSLYFLQARPMKPLPKYKDAVDKILDMILN